MEYNRSNVVLLLLQQFSHTWESAKINQGSSEPPYFYRCPVGTIQLPDSCGIYGERGRPQTHQRRGRWNWCSGLDVQGHRSWLASYVEGGWEGATTLRIRPWGWSYCDKPLWWIRPSSGLYLSARKKQSSVQGTPTKTWGNLQVILSGTVTLTFADDPVQYGLQLVHADLHILVAQAQSSTQSNCVFGINYSVPGPGKLIAAHRSGQLPEKTLKTIINLALIQSNL